MKEVSLKKRKTPRESRQDQHHGDFHVAIPTPAPRAHSRVNYKSHSARGFPAPRRGGARASAASAFPLFCSVIGPRLRQVANECPRGMRRGQYGFPHLVTVEETVSALMEKPRGVEVNGRAVIVSGNGFPENLAREALL